MDVLCQYFLNDVKTIISLQTKRELVEELKRIDENQTTGFFRPDGSTATTKCVETAIKGFWTRFRLSSPPVRMKYNRIPGNSD
jgi:hypothetical protein